MNNLPLKYGAIMRRQGFSPGVVIIAFTIVVLFVGGAVVAWKTPYLDYYLPQAVKEFLGKSQTAINGVPTTSDTSEPFSQDSEPTAEDPTKDWKIYTNNEFGFSFKYPGDWRKKQNEYDNEVVLLESSDAKTYLNFYNSGGAFGGEPGWVDSDEDTRKTYITSDGFRVVVEVVYTGGDGEVVASGNFNQQTPGLVFTFVFNNSAIPDGLDVLTLILSTFKFL